MQKISKINWLLSSHKSLSISRFVYLSLYETERGYYKKKKVGEDFVTSPQISQMFGECIAVFFSMIEKNSFKKSNFLELGPGNGLLLKDLIRSVYQIKKEKINYYFLEKSNLLKKSFLENLKTKAKIIELKKFNLEQKPHYFICNEFLDALPVNQFEKKNNKFYEKRITMKNKTLKIINKKLDFFFKRIH